MFLLLRLKLLSCIYYVKDQGELHTLVDLAMIMAQGQGDYEVGKVTALHTSVLGYAPLIFELKEDCSLKKFLELGHNVWQNLAADEQLPQKFVSYYLSSNYTVCSDFAKLSASKFKGLCMVFF